MRTAYLLGVRATIVLLILTGVLTVYVEFPVAIYLSGLIVGIPLTVVLAILDLRGKLDEP